MSHGYGVSTFPRQPKPNHFVPANPQKPQPQTSAPDSKQPSKGQLDGKHSQTYAPVSSRIGAKPYGGTYQKQNHFVPRKQPIPNTQSYDDLGYGRKKPMHERTVVYSGRQVLMTSNTQSTGVGVGQLSQDEKPIYAASS